MGECSLRVRIEQFAGSDEMAGDGVRGGLVQGEQLGPDLRRELFGHHGRRYCGPTGLPGCGLGADGAPGRRSITLRSADLRSAGLRSTGLGPAGLGSTALGSTGLGSTGLGTPRPLRPGTAHRRPVTVIFSVVVFSVVSHRGKDTGTVNALTIRINRIDQMGKINCNSISALDK